MGNLLINQKTQRKERKNLNEGNNLEQVDKKQEYREKVKSSFGIKKYKKYKKLLNRDK